MASRSSAAKEVPLQNRYQPPNLDDLAQKKPRRCRRWKRRWLPHCLATCWNQGYNKNLRPFIDEVQTEAIRRGLETLVPRTEEAIRKRNMGTGAF